MPAAQILFVGSLWEVGSFAHGYRSSSPYLRFGLAYGQTTLRMLPTLRKQIEQKERSVYYLWEVGSFAHGHRSSSLYLRSKRLEIRLIQRCTLAGAAWSVDSALTVSTPDFDLPKGNVRMRCSSPAGTCECLRRVWRFLICLRARCVRDLQVLWGLVNICGVFGDFDLPKGPAYGTSKSFSDLRFFFTSPLVNHARGWGLLAYLAWEGPHKPCLLLISETLGCENLHSARPARRISTMSPNNS